MTEYYDISLWQEHQQFNTGGTRNKSVYQNPDNESMYFFKTSLKKIKIDYKYEFWSEIVASKLGHFLGFNILKYDIAFNGNDLGCISKSMVDQNQKESLIEGYKFLTGFNPNYDVVNKCDYTFQFIREALISYKLSKDIDELIKVIIFDSIIGNGDRHQENWGFISKLSIENVKDNKLFSIFKNRKPKYQVLITREFSPIYDSGSCLAREIDDYNVTKLLNDNAMISAFINRGKSEIHWNGKKLNHFELIKQLKTEYSPLITKEIKKVSDRFNLEEIRKIVMNVDKALPSALNNYKIPMERKELIVKIITLRCKQLISII